MSIKASLNSIIILVVVMTIFILVNMPSSLQVEAFPTASVNLFSHGNKIEDKISNDDSLAEQSFHQFIHSKPDSTIIGELKPNSSELEIMLLKNKIASTIQSMQEMEKANNVRSPSYGHDQNGADCFIEVTRVERVQGKCHKVNNGLPICQSDNYMAINTDCN